MPTNTVTINLTPQYTDQATSGAPQPPPVAHSRDHWKNVFVPQTSKSWDGKPLCADEFDENPNCCASGYDIDAVLEQAYEDGLEDHSGVKALENHPCVSAADLEALADELVTRVPQQEKNSQSFSIPGAPKNLDPHERTDVIFDTKILDYCASLVHRMVTASYGGKAELPEKATLGEKFGNVFKFCAYAITERVSIIDVLKNSFMHKKEQIQSSFIPFTTRGFENREDSP